MPEISRFLGISIRMYYREHEPPHFHAEYGGYAITVTLLDGVVDGRFPRRSLSSVLEWYQLHRDELIYEWERARQHLPLRPIAPLE